jgi:hypothetical protein
MKRLVINLILLLLFVLNAGAQDVSFTASLNKNPVSAGEQFQLTLSLNNTNGSDFKAPNFGGLRVLSGPSTMQSQQYVNGRRSSSISYTYALQADKPGKYTIGPASINANGKRLQSNQVQVNVVKGTAKPQQGGNNQQQNVNQQASDYIKNKILVKASASKSTVMLGEQLTITYKLFYHPQLQIAGVNATKMPSFNGFWNQEIDLGNVPTTRENVNGVTFITKEIKKAVLIPQQTGDITIEPMDLDFTVALPVQNGWFTDYQNFKQNVQSNKLSVKVNPLPGNQPTGFSGAVGSLKFTASMDKNQTKENEPVTLKIQISGTGNLKLLQQPSLNLPPSIDSFDPKVNENISVTASGVSGSKTFEYLLIPRHEGEYKIPPVVFSYYNLEKKKYETFSSDEFVLKVDKGDGTTASTVVNGTSKEDIKYIGKDIRYLKANLSGLQKKGNGFFLSMMFFILGLLPLALFALLLFYRQRKQKLNDDFALLKNRRATKLAKKRLASARKYLATGQKEKFFEEITRGLWGYLSDKLAIPVSDLTKDTAGKVLEDKKIDDELIQSFLSTIDYCEFARFAPMQDSFDMTNFYNEAKQAIASLEGVLK